MTSFRRIVIKVGTSTLTGRDGHLDQQFIANLASQIARVYAQGVEVILVSSGAIKAGRERLKYHKGSSDSLPLKQAAAAVGQGLLIQRYAEVFDAHGITTAQILLTRDDLSDRKRFLNARNTLLALLSLKVIPILNENDTVAVDEIKFGDNDMLAAQVSTLIEADLLLIISDVDGLCTSAPNCGDTVPSVIPIVDEVTSAIEKLAGGSKSGVGTGGMSTKVNAAKLATTSGIPTVIANGRRPEVVSDTYHNKQVGTLFLAQPDTERLSARKRWIAHSARLRGAVKVDSIATQKLKSSGVSLLAVGITSVSGTFGAGDLVEIRCNDEVPIGRGLVNYSANEIRQLQGLNSDRFESVLGYRGFDEIIHRDNLVIEDSL